MRKGISSEVGWIIALIIVVIFAVFLVSVSIKDDYKICHESDLLTNKTAEFCNRIYPVKQVEEENCYKSNVTKVWECPK